MSEEQPEEVLRATIIGEGVDGLNSMTVSTMLGLYDPMLDIVRRSLAVAYVFGYNEAMEGKPAAVPGFINYSQAPPEGD